MTGLTEFTAGASARKARRVIDFRCDGLWWSVSWEDEERDIARQFGGNGAIAALGHVLAATGGPRPC